MKDSDWSPQTGQDSPYRALLQKLSGVGLPRPRQKTASNVWRKSFRAEIESEAQRRLQDTGRDNKKKLASIRQTVASEMFATLSDREKQSWQEQVEVEHEAEVAEWEQKVNGPPSADPLERQRCINSLVKFAMPILDGIREATGWNCSLIAGGPEPASEGHLKMISMHSGTTAGDYKMNFSRADHVRYDRNVVPVYADFLRKCYSPEECRARALSPGAKREPVDPLELQVAGASVYTVSEYATPTPLPYIATFQPFDLASTSYPPANARPCRNLPSNSSGAESQLQRFSQESACNNAFQNPRLQQVAVLTPTPLVHDTVASNPATELSRQSPIPRLLSQSPSLDPCAQSCEASSSPHLPSPEPPSHPQPPAMFPQSQLHLLNQPPPTIPAGNWVPQPKAHDSPPSSCTSTSSPLHSPPAPNTAVQEAVAVTNDPYPSLPPFKSILCPAVPPSNHLSVPGPASKATDDDLPPQPASTVLSKRKRSEDDVGDRLATLKRQKSSKLLEWFSMSWDLFGPEGLGEEWDSLMKKWKELDERADIPQLDTPTGPRHEFLDQDQHLG